MVFSPVAAATEVLKGAPGDYSSRAYARVRATRKKITTAKVNPAEDCISQFAAAIQRHTSSGAEEIC